MREEGYAYPGVAEVLEALHGRDDVIQSLLTGNIQPNAVLKVSAFGLDRWLDFEVGAYGSDPHEERSDLVAVARERAAAKYGEPTGAVLVGDTPLDVRAAHEAGARAVAVATGFADPETLRALRPRRLPRGLHATRPPRWRRSPPLDAAADRLGLGRAGSRPASTASSASLQPRRCPRRCRSPARRGSAAEDRHRGRTRPAWSWRRTRAPPPGSRRAGTDAASRRPPGRAPSSPRTSPPDSARRRWG